MKLFQMITYPREIVTRNLQIKISAKNSWIGCLKLLKKEGRIFNSFHKNIFLHMGHLSLLSLNKTIVFSNSQSLKQ